MIHFPMPSTLSQAGYQLTGALELNLDRNPSLNVNFECMREHAIPNIPVSTKL